jgi:hypothetical protein
MKKLYFFTFLLIANQLFAQLPKIGPAINLTGKPLASGTESAKNYKSTIYEVDTFLQIYDYLNLVDSVKILASIQHLQDFGTRKFNTPEALLAQEWIKQQFESYGLTVELQDFPTSNGESSDNVIATLPGKLFPDEYIVMGSHYDSYTYWGSAPGADDNASGTAGVLEAARILSQYQFDRSIIFCTFSAEEIGLYGSEAYASRAQQQGMNILGYLNMDMIGYVKPGDIPHTDVIAPASAYPLVDFYTNVAAIYMPDFQVSLGNLTGGDSDHTSFNEHGYMGIFPFEDDQNYSPFIHSPSDLIGESVNNMVLASSLVKATLASAVTMALPTDNVGIESNKQNEYLSVSPVPANNMLNINSNFTNEAEYTITDISGSQLFAGTFTGSKSIAVNQLNNGLYILKAISNGRTFTKKIVVNK